MMTGPRAVDLLPTFRPSVESRDHSLGARETHWTPAALEDCIKVVMVPARVSSLVRYHHWSNRWRDGCALR